MDSIGVLGIGRMGEPIARALTAAGLPVVVYDHDPARIAGVGLPAAANAEQLVRSVDVLVTVLPDGEATRTAEEHIVALRPGALWIDLASGDPRVTSQLAARCDARGIRAVTATMGGGPDDAAQARLTLYVSGSHADRAAAAPVLAALTRAGGLIEVGVEPHHAQVVKLLANLLWFGQVIAVTEALLLGVRLGLDRRVLTDALRHSAGGSAFLDRHVELLLSGDYLEDFALDRCVTELRVVTELAHEAQTPWELSSLVTRIHEQALERFGPVLGELLAARLIEEQAGTTLSSC